MTVQDNIQSLIRELEQILWQDRLKDHPEVSFLLERIRHYLLMGQSTLKNDDHFSIEQLSEMILHRLDSRWNDRILQVEVEKLHNQRDNLLKEIAILQQEKTAIFSNLSQELSPHKNLSFSSENPLTESVQSNLKPLLEELDFYADSLEHGIERMYRLGQQGETQFLAYLNRLQEKLELFLQAEKNNNKILTSDDWYLGLEIKNNQIEGYLFSFNAVENFTSYSFSELLNLANIQLFDHENLLENLKEKLKAFNHISDLPSVEVNNNIPLKTILDKIKAIVLISSSKWNNRDRNLLKNVIGENFDIGQGKEIIWLPKSMALTLSYVHHNLSNQASLFCVINLTETMTELSIVDLSQGISGIITKQLFYGIQGIDQDILCQLIYPQWSEKITPTFPLLPQPFPTPGIAEIAKRKSLQQSLKNNSLGSALIEASQLTRLILQQQEEFTSSLCQQSWFVNRNKMIEIIINPWIKSIHQKLEILLSKSNYSSDSIAYILLAGEGLNCFDYALIPWLTQIFPNGKVVEVEKQLKEGQLLAGLQDFLK
ncbi:hypothetical protein [Crocosphaera sp.]|uniref:hypothetical protein n=1 Tax=Crocosphaera sp. TaxID=2729996 RepID=UPI003F25D467|nr:hypothetical protein [Crocosphaera sp.]